MSQVTSHILDTSTGLPATGVHVSLFKYNDDAWTQIASAVTNADGRVPALLPGAQTLPPGDYKLKFDTGAYFEGRQTSSFYPWIEIIFTISDSSHYHIPLLLSPYGYSSYRGS